MFNKTKELEKKIELLEREIAELRNETRNHNKEFEALKRMLQFKAVTNRSVFDGLYAGLYGYHAPTITTIYEIVLPGGAKIKTLGTPTVKAETKDYRTETIPAPVVKKPTTKKAK